MLNQILLIGAFGLLGVLLRAGITFSFRGLNETFPVGTLLANLLGCFAVGVIYALAVEHLKISREIGIPIMVGFLGGLTTFSSYALESLRLFESGQMLKASLYFAGSPLLGLAAAAAGLMLARLSV